MNHRDHSRYTLLLKLVLVGIVVCAGFGCEDLLPEKFKQKEFTPASVDNKAAAFLSRNVTDSTGKIISSASHIVVAKTLINTVGSPWRDSLIANAYTENRVIKAKYDDILDSLQGQRLIRDSLMTIDYPDSQKISYASLSVSAAESKDIYIYEGMQFNQDTTAQHQYNQNNLNEYITIQLVRNDTSVVSSTEDMPSEAISGSAQLVPVPGYDLVVPCIRARYKLHLSEGTYLVRFIVSSPNTVKLFKAVILSIQ